MSTVTDRHFAPYGSTNALCGETVPKGVAWMPKQGEYASPRFTVERDQVTCDECLRRMRVREATERAVHDRAEVKRLSAALADMEGRALAAEAAREGYRQEAERLRAEVHELEKPHACSYSGMAVATCREAICDCFGGSTWPQRCMDLERAARDAEAALAERDATLARVEALIDEWESTGSLLILRGHAAVECRAALAGESDG